MRIVKFSTPSCSWCKVVAPHVEKYAQEHGMELIEVDAEADKATAERYGVMTAPVVVFEDGDKVMAKATGFPEIMKLLNNE